MTEFSRIMSGFRAVTKNACSFVVQREVSVNHVLNKDILLLQIIRA